MTTQNQPARAGRTGATAEVKGWSARLPSPALISLALACTTLAVFGPVTGYDFVNYDDSDYVTANEHVQSGLKWGSVVWAFQTGHASNWHPVTWLSHELDCQLFGQRAGRHHVISLLLHTANTVLLFLLLSGMTAATWRSTFVAALFALHPLHVESVAWISERKDVLSAFFGLLCLCAYARYVKELGDGQKRSVFYSLALLLLALGLMSKPMLVTWPFLLLLLDWWPLGRLELKTQHSKLKTLFRLVVEKVPFLFLAAASCVITFIVQRKGGAVSASISLGDRIANALVSYVRYLGKMLWPHDLSVLYPHPGTWPSAQVIGSAAILLAISAAVIGLGRRGAAGSEGHQATGHTAETLKRVREAAISSGTPLKRGVNKNGKGAGRQEDPANTGEQDGAAPRTWGRPWLVMGWFWFLGTLVPVIGLVQVGIQSMADRYSYLPLIGLFIIVAWTVAEWVQWFSLGPGERSGVRGNRTAELPKAPKPQNAFALGLPICAAASVILCGMLTTFQIRYWRDSEALFRHATQVTRNNYLAYNNLGFYLSGRGKIEEAMECYRRALEIRPDYEDAHNNLGYALAGQKKYAEAIAHYRVALRIRPDHVEVHNNLGNALSETGDIPGAIEEYLFVLRHKPDHADAHNNLGIALAMQGKLEEAIPHFHDALRFKPDYASAHSNLGNALAAQHKLDEAIKEYHESLRMKPDDAQAHNNLGNALAEQGKLEEAIGHYTEALRLNADNPEAQFNLGMALERQGKRQEAIAHYREALRLKPDYNEARRQLDASHQ